MRWVINRCWLVLAICVLLVLASCISGRSTAITQPGGQASPQEIVDAQPDSGPSASADDETRKVEEIEDSGMTGVDGVAESTKQAVPAIEQLQETRVENDQDDRTARTAQPPEEVSPTPDTRLDPKYWPEWPLIPIVSARAKEIYTLGRQLGNDPHSFTTIGDCQSEPSVFMGVYDSERYFLGEGYEHLEETIQQFKGSFQRDSVTVKDGMSVASVLSPVWADSELCEEGETPLACEIRLHRPVVAFINLGTNWQGGDDVKHEAYLRQVVEVLIENGVVPIISTKGDNLEGDHRLNRSMARVAHDYDLPLWNFWRSLRDLPGKGLDDTRPGGYLTTEAWARRSFTGLQALDSVWRELNK